jgi:hypothetical protein
MTPAEAARTLASIERYEERLADGDLARHSTRLEGRTWSGRELAVDRFEVRYRITSRGDAAFRRYLRVPRSFLGEMPAG